MIRLPSERALAKRMCAGVLDPERLVSTMLTPTLEAARAKLAAEGGDPAAEHGTDKDSSVTVGQEDTRD